MNEYFRVGALVLALLCGTAHADDVLAPGDVDGDGIGDLIRIGPKGVVQVVGTDGTPGHSFETFRVPEPSWWVPGMPVSDEPFAAWGAVLPDLNTNGSKEIVITGLDRYRGANFYGRTEAFDCEVWDPMTRSRLWRAEDCGWNGIVVADQNGNGSRDVAFHNHWHIKMYDSASGAHLFTNRIRYPARDLLANQGAVGILGDRYGDLRDVIELRDPATAQITQRIWLGGRQNDYLRQAQLIPDLNENWSWEWAILKIRYLDHTLRTEVNFRDSRTGQWLYTVHFIGSAEPLKMMIVNGDEIAVISRYRESGAQPLEVRSARTGALKQRVWFPKTLTIDSVTRVPDINGNGSHEVAVIGEQWGKPVSILRDTATGRWLRRIVWDN